MKLFRNPLVVGLLVVAALGLVYMNVVAPMLRRAPRAAPTSGAAAPPRATTPITAALRATDQARELTKAIPAQTASATKAASLAMESEPSTLRKGSTNWKAAPRRDPFQIRLPTGGTTNAPPTPPAGELLSLGGIWRQTGSSLATINQRVMREGDSLLGFKIEKIDADRVWVRGSNGLEFVEFKVLGGAPTPGGAPGTPKSIPRP